MPGRQPSKVNVVQRENEEPIAAEIIANSIVAISDAMRRIESTRLTRTALVTLIHANSKVPKRDIELVLNNLDDLEHTWLKPKTERKKR